MPRSDLPTEATEPPAHEGSAFAQSEEAITCGGRFKINSFLGVGGMGTVFDVYDLERNTRLALKRLHDIDPKSIYRLKREFRTLAGIVHPNLVTLHELIHYDGQWQFTMELIDGEPFCRRWPAALAVPSEHHASDLTSATVDSVAAAQTESRQPAPADGESETLSPQALQKLELKPLLDGMQQLCAGLDCLRKLGKAHGDVKPMNVLREAGGRVVLLDFGIAQDLEVRAPVESARGSVQGTPAYMSPELFAGTAPTHASDMYAVGVMLFEALTQARPASSMDPAIQLDEHLASGAFPSSWKPALPTLRQLCSDLLSHDPSERPDAASMQLRLARVAGRGLAPRSTAAETPATIKTPFAYQPLLHGLFVHREAELAKLSEALGDLRPGAARVVVLTGESGIGKSELMGRALDELAAQHTILRGRCYEREQVPYRALDRLIDALSAELEERGAGPLRDLIAEDAAALARMFPVLTRVQALAELTDAAPADQRSPMEQRRGATTALRNLLAGVGEGQRVVLFIDDLQWGDEESARILSEILLSSDSASLVLAACQRSASGQPSPFRRLVGHGSALPVCEIQVEGLAPEHAQELAERLLGPEASHEDAAAVVREAHGNPFLIREQIEYGQPRGGDTPSLQPAIHRHLALLSHDARQIIEALAVAGRCLDARLVAESIEDGQAAEGAIALLCSQRLARASDLRGRQIEPYHDRIREAVFAGLTPPQRARHHQNLATGMERIGGADPALLGFHLEGAGEPFLAGEQIIKAARNAERALAFLNASDLTRKALALLPEADPRRTALRRRLADNLSAAGRGAEAAPIFLELATSAAPSIALELRRMAATAWLYTGHFEKAREVLREVLDASGIDEPRTMLGVGVRIASEQLRMWRKHRGLEPELRPLGDIPAHDLLRIDAYDTASELYSTIDLTRSYLCHRARMRCSLEAGEASRIARGWVHEVVMSGIGGSSVSKRSARLLAASADALGEGPYPEERALITYARGIQALLEGRYADTIATLDELSRSATLYRCGFQLRMVRSVLGYSRWWLGQWRSADEKHRAWIAEAGERGDLLSNFTFRLEQAAHCGALLDDRPEAAQLAIDEALAKPPTPELNFELLLAKQAQAWIWLYRGEGARATAQLALSPTERVYLSVQRTRVEMLLLRSFAALASGQLPEARRYARRLRVQRAPWARPMSLLLRAAIAAAEGRDEQALQRLNPATAALEREGFELFAAAARWRQGELRGGDEGSELVRTARQRLESGGARAPERVVAMLAPGFGA